MGCEWKGYSLAADSVGRCGPGERMLSENSVCNGIATMDEAVSC